MLEILQGTIEKIIYENSESGFAILKLKEYEKGDEITALGNFPSVKEGEHVRIEGEWIVSPKYGKQFKVQKVELLIPSSKKGIEKFLASGLIKGIGNKYAKKIVEKFGERTVEILDKSPEELKKTSGIGEKKLELIKNSWNKEREKFRIISSIQEFGISINLALKIYKFYKNNSLEVIKNNPYQLALDIWGVGFKTADKIALSLGIDPKSFIRIKAYILYLMEEDLSEGNVFSIKNSLIKKAAKQLEVEEEEIGRAVEELKREKLVIEEPIASNLRPNEFMKSSSEILTAELETYQKALYLPFFYKIEREVAESILNLLSYPKLFKNIDVSKWIEETEKEMGIEFAEKQKEAIKKAIDEKVIIITGGPGTGKTTLIRAISKIYRSMGKLVVLCAPTGRAAKRLGETSGEDAKTIHRLLEYRPQENRFFRNENNPLKADLVVIDEFSMVDLPLFYNLVKAIPSWTSLLIVGDKDQLPSVGPGNVLKDIIESNAIPVVELNEIFRQAKKSMIVLNSHRIRRGEFPYLPKDDTYDFQFIPEEDENEVYKKILELSETIPRKYGFESISSDVQLISPMYKGIIGVDNLNRALQKLLNPSGKKISEIPFHQGDKVMQIKNNYDKEVFNGDMGKVMDISERRMRVKFEDREIEYGREEFDELVLSYAISIHKSQGSEYIACIIPLLTQHYIMLQRNLLYTALTRAKKLAIIIGSKKALFIAIRNNKPLKRNTNLSTLLQKGVG
ncbi:MAG: ATP-dependent RecD-like DNA helicase [Acidobacteriota bacterium]